MHRKSNNSKNWTNINTLNLTYSSKSMSKYYLLLLLQNFLNSKQQILNKFFNRKDKKFVWIEQLSQ